MVALHRLVALPALLLALTACGEQSDEPGAAADPTGATTSATTTAPSSELPACDEVWVAGQDLPGKYRGCFDGSADVPADRRECSFGKPLVTYADEYYALPGRVVNHVEEGLDSSEVYQSALAGCTG